MMHRGNGEREKRGLKDTITDSPFLPSPAHKHFPKGGLL